MPAVPVANETFPRKERDYFISGGLVNRALLAAKCLGILDNVPRLSIPTAGRDVINGNSRAEREASAIAPKRIVFVAEPRPQLTPFGDRLFEGRCLKVFVLVLGAFAAFNVHVWPNYEAHRGAIEGAGDGGYRFFVFSEDDQVACAHSHHVLLFLRPGLFAGAELLIQQVAVLVELFKFWIAAGFQRNCHFVLFGSRVHVSSLESLLSSSRNESQHHSSPVKAHKKVNVEGGERC